MADYDEYFKMQMGGGHVMDGGIGRIYVGSPYQRGHGGIGSFLAGIFRRVLPLFSRGARAVGKEALRAGMNIASDVTAQNTPIKESLRNRLRESGHNLKRKAEEKLDKLMEGSGYKTPRVLNSGQLRMLGGIGVSSTRKTVRKKKKRNTTKKRKSSTIKKKKKTSRTRGKKRKVKKVKRTTRDIFD